MTHGPWEKFRIKKCFDFLRVGFKESHWSESWLTSRWYFDVLNFEIFVVMIWAVGHFVITQGHFGAFLMPLRPHKTSYQYPLRLSPVDLNYCGFFLSGHFSKSDFVRLDLLGFVRLHLFRSKSTLECLKLKPNSLQTLVNLIKKKYCRVCL